MLLKLAYFTLEAHFVFFAWIVFIIKIQSVKNILYINCNLLNCLTAPWIWSDHKRLCHTWQYKHIEFDNQK